MQFQPSRATSLTPIEESDFFDISDTMADIDAARVAQAKLATGTKRRPSRVLLAALGSALTKFHPRALLFDRGFGHILLMALIAWPAVAGLNALALATSPAAIIGVAAATAGLGGGWCMARARDDLFSRLHFAMMVAALLSLLGWPSPSAFVIVIGPALLAYGICSWVVLVWLAVRTPAARPAP